MKRVKPIYKILIYAVLILVAICCIYPFLLVLGSSFQSQNEIMSIGYKALPKAPTLSAYKSIFASPQKVIDSYVITIITSVIVTILGTWMTATMGYVVSRHDYRFRRALSFFIFFTMMFNGGLVPTYILISKWLHMSDTIWALIVPILMSAWNIMLMKGYFQSIPVSLIEAAKIDGLGEMGIFMKIVMPLSKPAFATVGLLFVLTYWNEWY